MSNTRSEPQVHPTAIIGSDVRLAAGVVVGPHCVLEGDIQIAEDCVLMHHVYMQGPLVIGRSNRFFPNTAIGYPPQDRRFGPGDIGSGVHLGDGNIIRENVSIHQATGDQPTRLGDQNMLMCNTHIAHDCQLGNRIVLANGSQLAGHVHVADQVFMGGNSVVHQFCRVGRLAMLGGLSGVTQDIPPFCTVTESRRLSGLNLVGLRRAGLRNHVKPLQQAYRILFQSHHDNAKGIAMIRAQLGQDALCLELAEFVATSQRGVCRHNIRHRPKGAVDHG